MVIALENATQTLGTSSQTSLLAVDAPVSLPTVTSHLIQINTEFLCRLMRLGIPLLRLWGTDLIDGVEVCRCRDRERCPKFRAGKHLAARLRPSVLRSEEDLLKWIEEGGNVGISLHFNKPGAPKNPLRFVVFDDDDGSARAWLEESGITSPLIVKGRRGSHVYALLPDDVPDFYTRYVPFGDQPPKLDVKTSGLIVLPMVNGKRLWVDGQEVTLNNMHLLDRFNSLEGLRSWLPKVDPRTVIPGMKVREVVEESIPGDAAINLDVAGAAVSKRKKRSKTFSLSTKRPQEQDYHPNYAGIPYHERKHNAETHAGKVYPSIPGREPMKKLVKVVNDCIHQYGMSDRTTWEIVRDRFNPRCRYEDGRRYPWKKRDVALAIKWAHREGAYSTMTNLTGLAEREVVLARLRRKGTLANERRRKRLAAARQRVEHAIALVMQELDYVTISGPSECVRPQMHLTDGSMLFKDLYSELCVLLEKDGEPAPKEKVLGAWLRSMGLETYRGKIRRKVMDSYQEHKAA